MELAEILKNFLDEEKRLTAFPAKRKMQKYVLLYLSSRFEHGKIYTEKEVNAVIDAACAFRDAATIRRDLYDSGFLGRERNGRTYWLEERQPTLEDLGLAE